MMKSKARTYPVGVQSFKVLRERGYVYVDKTQYISQLLEDDSRYVFLSRPRRFGKSLLTSTFHEFFAGNRKLFEGLYIDGADWEWAQHPVLHFDMSDAKSFVPEDVEESISLQLDNYEREYGRNENETRPNSRLKGLIRRAYEQTDRQVVLLIDEYDAPMMEVLADEEALKAVRQIMRNFYSPIKSCDPYLRFVFLTGITKFSQMSIFSELNNLLNISMVPQFAGICGITKEELDTTLVPDIELLAERRGESREEVREQLRRRYDGYHFAHTSPDIFNPYSLLSAFRTGEIEDYWFDSATPAFLIEMLRKGTYGMRDITGQWVDKNAFDVAAERPSDLLPLLYQTGYLTIKTYDRDRNQYLLEMPNNEVRRGMTRNLIKGYVEDVLYFDNNILDIRDCIRRDDLDGAFRALQGYLAAKPFHKHAQQDEAHYQDLLYVMLSALGCRVDMEVSCASGEIDMVLYRPGRIYLMELKINSTAAAAMRQINDRAYARRFAGRQEKIIKVGLNFSTKKRNLTNWIIGDEA